MVANLCLITCALFTAQAPERSAWLIAPRLSQGQELVYRGSFAEEAVGKGVQFSRSYRLENRVLVLDTSSRGIDVALYTTLKLRTARPERGEEPAPSSVRLELARVSSRGQVTADPGVALTVPLEGPATIECGLFVEQPRSRIGTRQSWEIAEENRPTRIWKVVGTQVLNNTTCVKLEGLQQSADWDQPRADRTAWRRRDTVWLDPSLGVAYKVERTLERREPAHRDPTQRSFVQYELQTNITYPAQLFEGLRREILQARKFAEEAAPYLPNPTKYGPRPFEVMLAKIDHHLDSHPRTPYRDAVLQVKRRVEAGRRGESPPPAPFEETAIAKGAAVGQRAPDFAVTNLITRQSFSLRRGLGRPIVMVFYSPSSSKAEEVLRFAQRLQDLHGQAVTVLGLAVSDDTERICRQHRELGLSVPVLAGTGLRQSYDVDATPKLVLIDGKGVVRGGYLGWGPETSTSVTDDLRLWLGRDEPSRQK